MQTSPEDFRRHYASLSDEALLDIDPAELTDVAQQCYDAELAERDLLEVEEAETPAAEGEEYPGIGADLDNGESPAWLEDAACVCSFDSQPGAHGAHDAAAGCDALRAAGIPSDIVAEDKELRVMVPGPLSLHAASVLDKEIFNLELEATWKAHLSGLSDKDLRLLNPEMLTAGLADRIKRLNAAYRDEIARRGQ